MFALQENTAVGMTDGYAQASGRPSFVDLHTAAGLGGGIGNLTNALANPTPMVVTAGQQDRRHLRASRSSPATSPGWPGACSKWHHEVRHLGELGTILRRAFLDEVGDVDVPAHSHVVNTSVAGGLDDLATVLGGAVPTGWPSSPAMASPPPGPSPTWWPWPTLSAPASSARRCTPTSSSK